MKTLFEYSETFQNRYHIQFLKLHNTLRSTTSSTSNITWSSVLQADRRRRAAARTVQEGQLGRINTWFKFEVHILCTFKLASNIKGLGKFVDVMVVYLDDNYRKSHIFVQLKSKAKKKRITIQNLLAHKREFSLRIYFKSYIQIEKKFNCSELGVKMDGSVDENMFILYTNAGVTSELQSNKVTNIGEEKFLMTGGSVLQFNEEEHKTIYGYLQDLPKFSEFLRRFRIFYNQADEKQMESHIKSELQQSMDLPESEMDIAYMRFFGVMKEWCQFKYFVLKDTNSRKYEPLRKTAERLKTIR
jgi:hypothetical protein